MDASYHLRSAEYVLDGRRLATREDQGGDLNVEGTQTFYAGEIERGMHVAMVSLTYEGRSPLFGYIERYELVLRARITFQAEPDYTFQVRTKATVRDDWTTAWESRPRLSLEGIPQGAVLGVEVLPVSARVAGEAPTVAGAAKADAPLTVELTPEQEQALQDQALETITAVLREAEELRPVKASAQQPVTQESVASTQASPPPAPQAIPPTTPQAIPPTTQTSPQTAHAAPPVKHEAPPATTQAPPQAAQPVPAVAQPSAPRTVCPGVVVQFASNSAKLAPNARVALERVAACARADAELRLVLTGHADARGPEDRNEALGQGRAESAASLLARLGIDPSRLDVSSRGEREPVCVDDTDACHARNRRVVVTNSRSATVNDVSASR